MRGGGTYFFYRVRFYACCVRVNAEGSSLTAVRKTSRFTTRDLDKISILFLKARKFGILDNFDFHNLH